MRIECRPMTLEEARKRLAELEKKIGEYPYWGAALGAMDEEARALRCYITSLTTGDQCPKAKKAPWVHLWIDGRCYWCGKTR